MAVPEPDPSPVLQRAVTVRPAPARAEHADTAHRHAVDHRGVPEPFEPYEPQPVAAWASIDDLPTSRGVQDAARQAMTDIIAAEGPVEVQRLAKLCCRCFGLHRVSTDRRSAMLRYLPDGYRITAGGGTRFVWPAHRDPETWDGFRQVATSADRAFDEVAPEEVANAMRYALENRRGEGGEQLYRATRELLGYGRTSKPMEANLTRIRRWAVDTGRISGDLG